MATLGSIHAAQYGPNRRLDVGGRRSTDRFNAEMTQILKDDRERMVRILCEAQEDIDAVKVEAAALRRNAIAREQEIDRLRRLVAEQHALLETVGA